MVKSINKGEFSMEKEEIQVKLEQIKDYIENLNTLEVGQETVYSDEEIFGRNISDLFYKENEDDKNQENFKEEVRRLVDNAIDFVKRWYEEEFSISKEITLEEMLGNSESAKKMEDYMFGTSQEEEFMAELEEIKRKELIDKIKQAQQEGKALDAKLIEAQEKAIDK